MAAQANNSSGQSLTQGLIPSALTAAGAALGAGLQLYGANAQNKATLADAQLTEQDCQVQAQAQIDQVNRDLQTLQAGKSRAA